MSFEFRRCLKQSRPVKFEHISPQFSKFSTILLGGLCELELQFMEMNTLERLSRSQLWIRETCKHVLVNLDNDKTLGNFF